jgi:chemotaxis signal transduction protein
VVMSVAGSSCVVEMVSKRLGLFLSDSGSLAIPAEKLIQVLERPQTFIAPGLPAFVTGLARHLSQIVPVLKHGESGAGQNDNPAYLVLCGSSMGMVGFACDKVKQIVDLKDGRFEANEEKNGGGEIGSFFFQSEKYAVIDVDLLVECLPE